MRLIVLTLAAAALIAQDKAALDPALALELVKAERDVAAAQLHFGEVARRAESACAAMGQHLDVNAAACQPRK
jgi:hypothetical protein